ncbi:MAG TPA: 50S ribosomal protein L10 [Bdellovibrionales bacterium]|nr:50S ribosomal protein L10 [Bdellovibrionales bacterium]
MERARKQQSVDAIAEQFSRAKAAFLVDFKGITVEDVTRLRKKLRAANSEMKVVRNTLAKLALSRYPEKEPALKDSFTGTNAIVFSYEDASASAKVLSDFAKEVEQLQLKVGIMDNAKLDEAAITRLATLPSKEVLRAQFLGVLQAPMSKFVGTLAAVPGGFARLLNAKKQQLESSGS